MRVLVTGGSGYLGAHIAQAFARDGHQVVATTRNLKSPGGLNGPGGSPHASQTPEIFSAAQRPGEPGLSGHLELRELEVIDPDQCLEVAKDTDLIIHTVALNAANSAASDTAAVEVTGLGTANMLRAAVQTGTERFVYLSTFHVYGSPEGTTVNEDTPAFPTHNYGSSHLLAENFCLKYRAESGLATVVLRISNGYGAPLDPNADCWMLAANDFALRAVREGKIVLRSSGVQKRDMIAIPDIIQGIKLVSRATISDKVPVFCLGGENNVSMLELAYKVQDAAERVLGIKASVEFAEGVAPVPTEAERVTGGSQASLPGSWRYDITKIRSLGYSPEADMDEVLDNLVRFVADNRGEMVAR